MPKTKYPIFKCLHRGEKGFTLIELLIVVAILGVLAAVIVPNVGRFMGRGTLQAANTEAATVRTAVQAYVATGGDNPAVGTIGGGRTCTGFAPDDDTLVPINYFDGSLKAAYSINTGAACIITSADATITNGWGTGISWNTTTCEWT